MMHKVTVSPNFKEAGIQELTSIVALPCLGNSREETVEISVVPAVLFPLSRIIFRALSVANRELVYTVVWHKIVNWRGDGVM